MDMINQLSYLNLQKQLNILLDQLKVVLYHTLLDIKLLKVDLQKIKVLLLIVVWDGNQLHLKIIRFV